MLKSKLPYGIIQLLAMYVHSLNLLTLRAPCIDNSSNFKLAFVCWRFYTIGTRNTGDIHKQ